MKNYDGSLGKFQYDESIWSVSESDDKSDVLKYIGSEKDGSKISIPDGITDLSSAFENTGITSQPAIPDGVVKMDYTFYNCKDMTETSALPEGLESMNSCYAECKKIESTPYMPDSVKSAEFAFDGAENLRSITGYLPESLEKGTGMFSNCSKIESVPYLPDKLKHADSMFLNNESITDMPPIPDGCENLNYCFAGCKNLKSFTSIPETASHEGVFDNCDFTEDYIKSHMNYDISDYEAEHYDDDVSVDNADTDKQRFQTNTFVKSHSQVYKSAVNDDIKHRGNEFDIPVASEDITGPEINH